MFDSDIAVVHYCFLFLIFLHALSHHYRIRTRLLHLVTLNYAIFYVCYYAVLPESQLLFNITNVARSLLCVALIPVVLRWSYRRADYIYAKFYSYILYLCFVIATFDAFGLNPMSSGTHAVVDTMITIAEMLVVTLLTLGKIYNDNKNRDANRDAVIRDFLLHKD